MWMLIKSEINYSKYVMLGFYLFALPFFIWNAFSARAFRPSLQVMIFCVTVCCSILGNVEAKNKSIRIKRLLPMSFAKAAFFRISVAGLLTLIYGGSIAFSEFLRAGRLHENHILLLIQITAGLIIFLSAASLLSDLRYTRIGMYYQKIHPLVFPAMILSVAVIYFLTFNGWQISENFQNQFYTHAIAIRMVLLAALFFGASILVFFSRTTFTE